MININMDEEKIKKDIMQKVEEYYRIKFSNKEFYPGKSKIDPSGKLFDSQELKYGVEAILDGWWTEGKFAKEFERKFSDFLDVKSVTLTNSGSSANLLAFQSLTSPKLKEKKISQGDEIITTAVNFPTTVSPIIQSGSVPVFVDIEDINSGQYNIDVSKIENAITERTKAIFLAHTIGNPFNLEKIIEIKEKNDLWLIEDCCDAVGSKYKNKNVGTFGDLSTFSFYPAHHITMGEGGAVAINNSKLKKIVKSIKNWGRDCWCSPGEDDTCKKRFGKQIGELPKGYDHKNTYSHLGFNLKSTEMQAAIGLAQLEKIEIFMKRRKENFNYLYENLEKYEDKIILPQHLPESMPSWFGFLASVRKDAGFTKQEMENYLTKNNVLTRALFCGNITKQPCLKNNKYKIAGSLKNTDYVMNNTFWIGVQPNISEKKREYVIKTIDNFFKNK